MGLFPFNLSDLSFQMRQRAANSPQKQKSPSQRVWKGFVRLWESQDSLVIVKCLFLCASSTMSRPFGPLARWDSNTSPRQGDQLSNNTNALIDLFLNVS